MAIIPQPEDVLMPDSNSPPDCRIYGIRQCDTMKKAFTWLDDHHFAYAFVDYKRAGVVAERAPVWMASRGWEALINRRGLTWRRLSDEARAELDEARALALMIAHPTLIRRPVIELGEQVLIGFDAAAWRVALLGGADEAG